MALQKNKREICKDKQILMISRFYKPAFVTIIFLRTYYKRKRRGNARKKLKQLVSLRHCVFPIMTEKRQSMQKKRLYKSMRSIKHSWKRVVQSTKFYQKKQMKMDLLWLRSRNSIILLRLVNIWIKKKNFTHFFENKIWLINQVKVIYWMHKKRNRVELQFCFHTVF